MRRLFSILLILSMLVALYACKKAEPSAKKAGPSVPARTEETTPEPEKTAATTAIPEREPVVAATAAPEPKPVAAEKITYQDGSNPKQEKNTVTADTSMTLNEDYTPIQSNSSKGYNYIYHDGYIYYCVQTSDASFCLNRMKPDGTSVVRLAELGQSASWFAASNGKLYFTYDGAEGYGLYSMNLDGSGLKFCDIRWLDGLVAAGDSLYGIGGFDSSEIYRVQYGSNPSEASLGGTNPYPPLDVIGDWVYYTDIVTDEEDNASYDFYRVKTDGSGRKLLFHSGMNDPASVIGNYKGTVFYSIHGYLQSKLVGWDEKNGAVEYDIPEAFAVSDGWIYYVSNDRTMRYNIDSRKTEDIMDAPVGLNPEVVGDWIFYSADYGLNAAQMMVQKSGGTPQIVPGFGEYDYPEDEADTIEWAEVEAGSGDVCLIVRAYSQPSCFRLFTADASGSAGKMVLQQYVEPYTVCYMYFNADDYILKSASGDKWINDDEAFGTGGTYATTKVFTFEKGMQYELVLSYAGSFYKSSLDDFTR
jgi:hypothetical protein